MKTIVSTVLVLMFVALAGIARATSKRRCEATFERSGRGGQFGEIFRLNPETDWEMDQRRRDRRWAVAAQRNGDGTRAGNQPFARQHLLIKPANSCANDKVVELRLTRHTA